jgi:hypothetical protein
MTQESGTEKKSVSSSLFPAGPPAPGAPDGTRIVSTAEQARTTVADPDAAPLARLTRLGGAACTVVTAHGGAAHCTWCLARASSRCSGCRRAVFCSRACQRSAARDGRHGRATCAALAVLGDDAAAAVRGGAEALACAVDLLRLVLLPGDTATAAAAEARALVAPLVPTGGAAEKPTPPAFWAPPTRIEAAVRALLPATTTTTSSSTTSTTTTSTTTSTTEPMAPVDLQVVAEACALLDALPGWVLHHAIRPVPDGESAAASASASRPLAVFGTVALLNHSCDPNVIVYPVAPLELHAVTARKIAPGAQLTICYADSRDPRRVRRAALKQSHAFACRCARCAAYARDRAWLGAQRGTLAEIAKAWRLGNIGVGGGSGSSSSSSSAGNGSSSNSSSSDVAAAPTDAPDENGDDGCVDDRAYCVLPGADCFLDSLRCPACHGLLDTDDATETKRDNDNNNNNNNNNNVDDENPDGTGIDLAIVCEEPGSDLDADTTTNNNNNNNNQPPVRWSCIRCGHAIDADEVAEFADRMRALPNLVASAEQSIAYAALHVAVRRAGRGNVYLARAIEIYVDRHLAEKWRHDGADMRATEALARLTRESTAALFPAHAVATIEATIAHAHVIDEGADIMYDNVLAAVSRGEMSNAERRRAGRTIVDAGEAALELAVQACRNAVLPHLREVAEAVRGVIGQSQRMRGSLLQ